VNMVSEGLLHRPDCLQAVVGDAAEAQRLGSLCREVIPLRRTNVDDSIDVLFEDRDNLARAIMATRSRPVPAVNISLVFSIETADVLVRLFTSVATQTLTNKQSGVYKQALGLLPITSANVEAKRESCWNALRVLIERDQAYQLLQPLAAAQGELALNRFKEIFLREHAIYVQTLQIKEMDEALIARAAETKRLNTAREVSEKYARDEKAKAAALEADIKVAKAREKQALDEAVQVKGSAEQNKREAAAAQQRANNAIRERERLERDAAAALMRSQKLEKDHQASIAQIAESKRVLDQQLQQIQRQRDESDQRFRRDLDSLRLENAGFQQLKVEAQRLNDQVRALEARILVAQPHIDATNQRIQVRNQRIAGGGHHQGRRHGGGGGQWRVAWPLLPRI
ncbi:MAG: hypothetical protein WCG04_06460, partial [Alphaproteobacteria bacterium]